MSPDSVRHSSRASAVGPDGSLRAALAMTRLPFADARTLPAEVYTSEAVFRLEQQAIFARSWVCAGREADIPAAGDFFVQSIAGDSVIVVRGSSTSVATAARGSSRRRMARD